ncbi:MAG: putative metal-binding motif-containing protein [Deltaproteobacteria bacterium]|nr:putative metal-binding motif-containing protein [Myxococcales bacterium]MDP3213191.1 putative metal-binding motif-containing protein [Deltaproteobacteria bacterium]
MHLRRWLLPGVLSLAACADEATTVFTPEADAGAAATDAPAVDAGFDAALVDRPAAVDRPSVDARDGAPADTALFVDSGSRTPVCRACTGPDDCGTDGVCVPVSSGARACLPRCNTDVPVCPGRLRCVRDVALADVAVCAPLGGACCIDNDKDGYGQGVGCRGPDCDDDDPMRTGAAAELCNNADDDCDGEVDEALSRACTTACGSGTERCARGAWGGCTAPMPTTEVCGNMMDDDCDGMTDEGCTVASCDTPGPVRWNIPAGTVGGPACITAGGGYCEGTAHCSGATCYTTPPGGCGGDPHCGTLRCNDGSYMRARYCSVRATCDASGVVAIGFNW